MAAVPIEEEAHHTIEWDEANGVCLFTWTEYVTGEEFRASLNSLHEAIAERGVTKYLVDTRSITAHDDADKRWLAEEWIPRLVEDGVRYGAGVYPDSVIAEMDMEKIESQVNSVAEEYTFRTFGDPKEARDWLNRQ